VLRQSSLSHDARTTTERERETREGVAEGGRGAAKTDEWEKEKSCAVISQLLLKH